MVTVEGNNLVKLLENIKSKNGSTNLFEHLNKMYQVKKEMNDDIKYSDLFEDISIRIKKEGNYGKDIQITQQYPTDPKIKELLSPLAKAEGEGTEKVPITNINFVPE